MQTRNVARYFTPRTVLLTLILFSFPILAQSQTVNGAFHGTVTDPSGAVIPGATVKITNLATGTSRQVVSDRTGFYTITQVPPAHYSMTAAKNGFATIERSNVQLFVNQDREVDFTLQVGRVTQTVQVTSAPSQLETTTSTLGQVIQSQQVVDLPLNGRNFSQLMLLVPGEAPHGGDQQATNAVVTFGAGGISASSGGSTGRQNSFTMDGGSNNEIYRNIWTISPPPDAIQEFKVQTHVISARQGLLPGANVNVVTKSGGNEFHGDVWEFLRNDALDGANFFDNLAGLRKPAFRMNQYGFTFGGPVILPTPNGKYDGRKKKTYFFGYWEGFQSTQGFTNFANVPTPAEMGGNFSDLLTNTQVLSATGQPELDNLGRPIMQGQIYNPYSTRQVTAGQVDPVTGLVATNTGLVRDPFPGNIIPASMAAPQQVLTYLHAFYPLPNFGPGGNSFPNFVNASPQVINSNQGMIKIDHTFSNNDTLMGAYYISRPSETNPNALLLGTNSLVNYGDEVQLGYTHLFSPTFLGMFHYTYMKSNMTSGAAPGGVALLQATNQAGLAIVKDGIPEVPQISIGPRISGTNQFAIPEGPNRHQIFTADIQKVSGLHTFSAGAMWYHIHGFADGWGSSYGFDQLPTGAIAPNGSNIGTTGDGLASFLLDLPTNLDGFYGQTAANVTTFWQGYYLQDKWQASRKLTLTFGLRYDFVPPFHWANNRVSGFSNNCGCYLMTQPFGVQFPFANVRSTYFDPQYRGFQPRFGLAYHPFAKTVFRGGFAVFNDHGGDLLQETQDLRIPWPFGVDPNLVNINNGIPTNITFSNPPSSKSFFPNPQDPNAIPIPFAGANNMNKIPTIMEWNFGVQAQITPNTTAELTYAGQRSNHLQIEYTDNSPLPNKMGPGPVKGRGPYPKFGEFGYDTNVGYTDYNALEAQVVRTFSKGLTFLGSYTWSHCLSIKSEPYAGSLPNPYDLASNYGNCDYDIRHVFTFSSVYVLPFGQGKHFGGGWGRGLDTVLGGWQMGGILSAHSGPVFSVTLPFDNANTGIGGQLANQIGNPLPSGFQQNIYHWYNPAAFGVPAPFTFGDTTQNNYYGPSYFDLDFDLMKNFKFAESKYLQFRVDAFNIFNNVNFAPPGGGVGGGYVNYSGSPGTSVGSPNFMQILAAGPAREVQFALKIIF